MSELSALKDKLKKLAPLYDRISYESGEVGKAALASEQSIRHLLYLNKSGELHVDDCERVSLFLKAIARDWQRDNYKNLGHFLIFCIRYIESIKVSIKYFQFYSLCRISWIDLNGSPAI